jgi:hypothetical protein
LKKKGRERLCSCLKCKSPLHSHGTRIQSHNSLAVGCLSRGLPFVYPILALASDEQKMKSMNWPLWRLETGNGSAVGLRSMAASPDPSDRCKWSPWRKVKKRSAFPELQASHLVCSSGFWSAVDIDSFTPRFTAFCIILRVLLASPGVSFPAQGAISGRGHSRPRLFACPTKFVIICMVGTHEGSTDAALNVTGTRQPEIFIISGLFTHNNPSPTNSYSVCHLTKKCFIFQYLLFDEQFPFIRGLDSQLYSCFTSC